MKKLTALILVMVMALSLAACSGGNDPADTTADTSTTTPSTDTTTSAPDTTPAPDTTSAPDMTPAPDTTPAPSENLEGSLEDILATIYDTAEVDDDAREWLKKMATTEIPADNTAYFFGIENLEFEEAIASEPMMTSQAYSLCLLRVKDGTDIEQLKADIKANVNPAKWICVSVEDENVIVDNIGDVVVLIMHNDLAEALHNAFLALK